MPVKRPKRPVKRAGARSKRPSRAAIAAFFVRKAVRTASLPTRNLPRDEVRQLQLATLVMLIKLMTAELRRPAPSR